MRTSFFQFGSPRPAYYNGLLMRANPSLHEEALRLLANFAPKGSSIVDLGAGQGAFSSRLRNTGYEVTAVDKNLEDFKAEDVRFVALNFDDTVAVDNFRTTSRDSYDVAIGMEVIEHVENPWAYIRLLLDLIKPGGVMLITTPNAESAYSRIEFMLSGTFYHFSPSDFHGSGHINPLTFHELELIARTFKVEILALSPICPMPWIVISRKISVTLKSIIASILRPFINRQSSGDAICLILRKLS